MEPGTDRQQQQQQQQPQPERQVGSLELPLQRPLRQQVYSLVQCAGEYYGGRHPVVVVVRERQQRTARQRYAGIAGLIAASAGMAVILGLILFSTLGRTGMFVGLVMAFTPVPLYMLLYLWLDRFDPEPAWILAGAFGWGAIFSLLVSFVVNTLFGNMVGSVIAGPAGELLPAVLSAPIIEEASKGCGLVIALLFLRDEFDGILDGVVYAGVIALGFATGENVLYYGKTFLESGIGGLLMIGFLRGVLSPFAHSMFTSLTGIGCGIAREAGDKTVRFAMPVVGYLAAVVLHAMWNGFAGVLEDMFIIAYFVVWVPLFFIFVTALVLLARRERLILRRMLGSEVETGTLRKDQVNMIGSSARRLAWVFSSIGNSRRFRARRRFLRAVTRLGFCHWHVSRAAETGNQTTSFRMIPKLRQMVVALRPYI